MNSRRGIAVVLVGVACALAGCGSSPDKAAIHRAFSRGYSEGVATGHAKTAARMTDRISVARENGYLEGLGDGGSAAIPPNLHLHPATDYIVSFMRGQGGHLAVQYSLEMPLGTTWQCSDLKTCGQISGIGSSGGGDYVPVTPDAGSAPTTQNFGNGNGYVVTCADGTLSDSGGIQGACSHHGGVSP